MSQGRNNVNPKQKEKHNPPPKKKKKKTRVKAKKKTLMLHGMWLKWTVNCDLMYHINLLKPAKTGAKAGRQFPRGGVSTPWNIFFSHLDRFPDTLLLFSDMPRRIRGSHKSSVLRSSSAFWNPSLFCLKEYLQFWNAEKGLLRKGARCEEYILENMFPGFRSGCLWSVLLYVSIIMENK